MKLGEALEQRKELEKEIESLVNRFEENSKVQEGETPIEDPDDLDDKLAQKYEDLLLLSTRITETNHSTEVKGENKYLWQIILKRDVLRNSHASLKNAVDNASSLRGRFARQEIKNICTIDHKKYRKKLDDMAANVRHLNSLIQQINWETNLITI